MARLIRAWSKFPSRSPDVISRKVANYCSNSFNSDDPESRWADVIDLFAQSALGPHDPNNPIQAMSDGTPDG
jgi:hypothetical protein